MTASVLCFVGYALYSSSKNNLYLDAVLLVVVLLIAALCTVQEFKSDQSMEQFKNVLPPVVLVHRDGKVFEMDASELVIGDVIDVKLGDKIPADIRVTANQKLNVDNSSLTGKSEPQDADAPAGPGKQLRLCMKGAPERILDCCSQIMVGGVPRPMTDADCEQIHANLAKLMEAGERVLGFAQLSLPLEQYPLDYTFETEGVSITMQGLVFVGLMALLDPPRVSVLDAVKTCQEAGIDKFMVTGDMDWVRVLAHEQIVFARTSPQGELLIIENLQRLGKIVAVSGDGVKDTLVLKIANIGIPMGISGSDVSKEAADMVLLDETFASIVNGVEEGRLTFDNSNKSVAYTTVKVGAVDLQTAYPRLRGPFYGVPDAEFAHKSNTARGLFVYKEILENILNIKFRVYRGDGDHVRAVQVYGKAARVRAAMRRAPGMQVMGFGFTPAPHVPGAPGDRGNGVGWLWTQAHFRELAGNVAEKIAQRLGRFEKTGRSARAMGDAVMLWAVIKHGAKVCVGNDIGCWAPAHWRAADGFTVNMALELDIDLGVMIKGEKFNILLDGKDTLSLPNVAAEWIPPESTDKEEGIRLHTHAAIGPISIASAKVDDGAFRRLGVRTTLGASMYG
jgi:soluble P-type ATPase